MKRPRHLSPEERALWDMVARRTKPLPKQAARRPDRDDLPSAKPPRVPEVERPAPRRFRVGEGADHSGSNDLLPGLGERMRQAPVQMDAKSFGRMKRGKLQPEGRIDLHGMTLDEAHPALIDFILRAQGSGKRLVLVITGKGRRSDAPGPIPIRHGVLRHQVPQWIALPPLRPAVLQILPAHLRHGGEGAYYVYLRRG